MKNYWNIEKLHEWKDNPRNITSKDFDRLKAQITKLGQYKPLLITKDGEVIGGNMRLKAYNALGIKEVWVSVVEPKDENEKLEYALSDNDRAGYYDDDMLANLIPNYNIDWSQYAVDMKLPEDIQKLIDRIAPVEEDEAPEVDETQTISKRGEVYQLGMHRLMCGDSTKIEDVEKLMDGKKADMVFTDPPYGIALDTIWEHKRRSFKKIVGDENYFDISFLFNLGIPEICVFGADYFMPAICNLQGTMLVWDKRVEEAKDRMMLSAFEMLWVNKKVKKVIFRKMWGSFLGGKERLEVVHPTQKPLSLLVDVMKHLEAKENIVDLFGGSGSTLIACEQTNRICYMMEIDEKYCDVIRKRYAKFIDKEDEWQTITPKV